ncbi:hypothetical protein GCM10007938_04450 [Vibrio zhanjiangensis]|uniref:DUF1254 domain-containing protein n=1 Tax=Vibrio zhanjiangensis TaxID=1046128 RepID=A0ABQ6EV37_9VIBR|nr:hypothetical protein [Vibrio zhanjiangensis]GLT16669.1 hypothetical protein GCM10007938_04450 [Vibrio zhanjiangensis]
MSKQIAIVIIVVGSMLGAIAAYLNNNTINRHLSSHTVAYISSVDPDNSFGITLPLRLELILKQDSTYGVYAFLPKSQVGYTSSGWYQLDGDGIFFAMRRHNRLDIEAKRNGVIEQLFVRPDTFSGHMRLVQLGEHSAALVGSKVALHMID